MDNFPNNDEHLEAYESEIIRKNADVMHEYYKTLTPEMQEIMKRAEEFHNLLKEKNIPHLFYVDDCTLKDDIKFTKFYYPLKNRVAMTSKAGMKQLYMFMKILLLNICYWAYELKYCESCFIEYGTKDTQPKPESFCSPNFEGSFERWLDEKGGDSDDDLDI